MYNTFILYSKEPVDHFLTTKTHMNPST